MLLNTLFYLFYLEVSKKAVPLQCVFHSIRFKVNKGWSTAVLLFFMPVCFGIFFSKRIIRRYQRLKFKEHTLVQSTLPIIFF